jgi:hypothetical protein
VNIVEHFAQEHSRRIAFMIQCASRYNARMAARER